MAKNKVRKGVKADPKTVASIIDYQGKPPMLKGEGAGAGGVDYPCSVCGVILFENLHADTVSQLGVKCPKCGTVTYWD